MKRTVLALAVLAATVCLASMLAATRKDVHAAPSLSRTFEFVYVVHVPALPPGSHEMRIWLPLPQTGAHQKIVAVSISSPLAHRIYTDQAHGNGAAYFSFDTATTRTPFAIILKFRARRDEYRVALPSNEPASSSSEFSPDIARYLEPDRLVPINGMIADLSREQIKGISDPLKRARHIYDYVIRTMHYDHAGTGWGQGDAIFACTAHHGNCTDFHSLFIGMARAAGIPARFEIGFPIPIGQHQGEISGYHCWAEFYIQGIGWVPIDASEAWQMPDKHDYFFGALDPNRVRFSGGRDLVLSPRQSGSAVNYFVYPYAELDGKPFANLCHQFSFHDVSVE
ncbi:MAG TPA: transglutaminase domain-containing protein [Terriglobales bacterium]|nr:transglutaminase domain-containing protein [Terriglobales bacterium]